MSKIAYILLCHKNPKQIEMLIEQLSSEFSDFYIHIDLKCTDFFLKKRENLFLIPLEKRVDVQWAKLSMIEATLVLIKYVIDSNKRYDYVVLLSGQDYPIKSTKYIHEYFDERKGKNFIQILSHDSALYKRYCKRNEICYPGYFMQRTLFSKLLRRLYIFFTGGFNHTFKIFKRNNITGIEFEYGSQWWALTQECIMWIYEYISNHKEVMEFFEKSLVPDECFFQSLFSISPFANERLDFLTFFEWDDNATNPKLITTNELPILIKKEHFLFARKFDNCHNKDIINTLNQLIK